MEDILDGPVLAECSAPTTYPAGLLLHCRPRRYDRLIIGAARSYRTDAAPTLGPSSM